jgi:hypothetical protein
MERRRFFMLKFSVVAQQLHKRQIVRTLAGMVRELSYFLLTLHSGDNHGEASNARVRLRKRKELFVVHGGVLTNSIDGSNQSLPLEQA